MIWWSELTIMKNQLQLLFDLNQLDLKELSIRDELEKIPEKLAELESMLGDKKNLLAAALVRMEEAEKARRSREVEIEKTESRLADLQNNLSAIKTNKEYQAALKEMSESKKNNRLIEEDILKKMSEIEALKKEKEDLELSITDMSRVFEKERAESAATEARLVSEVEQIEASKKILLAGVDKPILAKYDRIRRIRREALSVVEGGTCRECNMRISPQLVIEIQKLKDIYACPSCHRILYLPEWQNQSAEHGRPKETLL